VKIICLYFALCLTALNLCSNDDCSENSCHYEDGCINQDWEFLLTSVACGLHELLLVVTFILSLEEIQLTQIFSFV
jgi:hypothetical protein